MGVVTQAYHRDDTWFAKIVVTVPDDSIWGARIRAFIAFSIDWHDRIDSGAEPEEFEVFADVLQSDWAAVGKNWSQPISGAPVFLADSEISWRPACVE